MGHQELLCFKHCLCTHTSFLSYSQLTPEGSYMQCCLPILSFLKLAPPAKFLIGNVITSIKNCSVCMRTARKLKTFSGTGTLSSLLVWRLLWRAGRQLSLKINNPSTTFYSTSMRTQLMMVQTQRLWMKKCWLYRDKGKESCLRIRYKILETLR